MTDNAFVGDETFAGDMPTPDQNQVDDIGRAMGVQEEDSGALRTSAEILDARDQRRALIEAPEPRRGTRERALSETPRLQRTSRHIAQHGARDSGTDGRLHAGRCSLRCL